MNLIASIFPIALLIYLMTKKDSVPSKIALPCVALLMYLVSLVFLQQDPLEVHAAVIDGLLTAITPISIILGAIFLFRTMEKTGALGVIRSWLNRISENRVAQLMIIGWAFAFLIEGASGFGTPAALAAPILVGLGFPPFSAGLFTLIMNSVPVSFGAVGTPTWFGFSGIADLSTADILAIGWRTGLIHSIAALVIPIIALRFVLPWREIKENLAFIYISILSSVIPYAITASLDYEFPALLGGFIGFILSILAAQKGIGLKAVESSGSEAEAGHIPTAVIVKSLFPLWGTLLILVLTRISALGIKALLTDTTAIWQIPLGTLGTFSVSSALVLRLESILGTPALWTYQLLYVPALIPFILISVLSFLFFRTPKKLVYDTVRETCSQLEGPVKALLGSLVFVSLLMMGGDRAPTIIIGNALARSLGWGWQFFSPFLGALGSFFSGSNTISNLTFAGIQDSIARELGLNRYSVLAAQSVGGAMGNMVCINNIVAVCSVLGLQNAEGKILKKTVIPLVIYGSIAGVLSFLF